MLFYFSSLRLMKILAVPGFSTNICLALCLASSALFFSNFRIVLRADKSHLNLNETFKQARLFCSFVQTYLVWQIMI